MWEDSSEHKRCKGVRENVVKKHIIVLALAQSPVEKLFFTRETCLTLDMGCQQIRKTWVDITKICTDSPFSKWPPPLLGKKIKFVKNFYVIHHLKGNLMVNHNYLNTKY